MIVHENFLNEGQNWNIYNTDHQWNNFVSPDSHTSDFDGLFSVQIHHKGFFCGSESNKTYMDYEVDWFDMCESDTWSMLWIKDFLSQLGHDMEASKLDVYWCQLGKTVADGLKLMQCDADIVLMIIATIEHKNLLLVVDHGETLQSSDDDVLITGVGCHIKTRYKGNILTAVGIDPNDCIFPIAFGICEVESTHSWEWFLASLKDDLNIINTSTFTIMSGRQKGLTNAVKKLFPDSEHRNYVRHIYQNFHKVHKGEQLKNDLWAIARSTNEAAYTRNMDKMRDHSFTAFNWVENLSPRTWIKAFFDPFCKCDILLNNMCEVFNSYILDGRELPIKSMLDYIFWKISNRMVGKQGRQKSGQAGFAPRYRRSWTSMLSGQKIAG